MMVMSMALLTAARCIERVATPSATVKDNELVMRLPPLASSLDPHYDDAPRLESLQGYLCQPPALRLRRSVSLSVRVSAALARRGLHYGWVVVATTFLTMLVTA